MRVLVVDDMYGDLIDPSADSLLLKEEFKRLDLGRLRLKFAVSFESAVSAMELAGEERRHDVIVTDLTLPVSDRQFRDSAFVYRRQRTYEHTVDPYTLFEAIKSHNTKARVLVFSGIEWDEDKIKYYRNLSSQFVGVVPKPVMHERFAMALHGAYNTDLSSDFRPKVY